MPSTAAAPRPIAPCHGSVIKIPTSNAELISMPMIDGSGNSGILNGRGRLGSLIRMTIAATFMLTTIAMARAKLAATICI